ncbi:hypothetical protein BDF14DRAFT_1908081 [Spinellus fusiger]|nr:hypothetical protein BDF14DRAFT_1908081 [Spinellus fusiger]
MAIIEDITETPHSKEKEEEEEFFDTNEYQREELESLLKEANEYKTLGNQSFASADYPQAIAHYENALVICPPSLEKDRAVYFSNIAACHMKQGNMKEASEMCEQAITLDPHYTKARLRKAQANEKIGTASALSEALKQYQALSSLSVIDEYTKKETTKALRVLPGRIKVQAEKDREEVMGKLKDLGNTLLGKFGLSTDNFQFQQDPTSGGYSMNFVNSNGANTSA